MDTLKAEKRSMDVTAKRLRREGFVIGNVIGRQIKNSIPLKMKEKDVTQLLNTNQKGSQITLDIEGESRTVLIKDIQYDLFGKKIMDMDFQALVSNEKVHSTAEITFVNVDKIVSGVFQESLKEISYKAYPSALVNGIKLDVGELKVGDVIRVKDLDIAKDKDLELLTDSEMVVASVFESKVRAADAEDETAE